MKLGDLARLTALLARIARGPGAGRPATEPRLEELRTPGGAGYDVYRPSKDPRGAVVAIHGVTLKGGRDARLVHFARSLASSRVVCAVPTLPGLGACRFSADDLEVLEQVTLALAADTGERPGLVGFSYGGSYALVVAGRDGLADRVRFVLSFGAYHALEHLFDEYVTQQGQLPEDEAAWEDWIYLHLVLAEQHQASLGLSENLRERVHELLLRYCDQATSEEKHRFFEEELRHLDLIGTATRSRDLPTLRALSPAGQLRDLRCPVSLIHDVHDHIVPPSQAARLHAELTANGAAPTRAHLLVTPLLSHVDLGSLVHLGQMGRLLAALAPLVES